MAVQVVCDSGCCQGCCQNGGKAMGVSKGTVLATWERRWGNLEPKWKNKFLNDQRLDALVQYDVYAVTAAIYKFKRLDEILTFLKQLPPNKPKAPRPSLKTNTPPKGTFQGQKNPSGKSSSAGQRRKRRDPDSDRPKPQTIYVGTPDAKWNPGGVTCKSCGMKVNGSSSYCRC